MEEIHLPHGGPLHVKEVNELCHGLGRRHHALQHRLPDFRHAACHHRILKEEGPSNDKIFYAGVYVDGQELGRGAGRSKQEAETNAAIDALSKYASPKE